VYIEIGPRHLCEKENKVHCRLAFPLEMIDQSTKYSMDQRNVIKDDIRIFLMLTLWSSYNERFKSQQLINSTLCIEHSEYALSMKMPCFITYPSSNLASDYESDFRSIPT
jgi:hypothetical protein